MKKNIVLIGLALLNLVACGSSLSVTQIQPSKNIAIDSTITEDQHFKDIIAPYKQELESKMNAKISHTTVELTKNGENSSLGNLLADFTYEGAADWANKNNIPSVDAAVINIGGIRSTIGAGDITIKHVFEVMPFENEVYIVKMKGSDLQGLFDYYRENLKNNPVSRLVIETDGKTFSQTLINGQPVDPNKTYYIATSDYLAFGGDRMFFFTKGENITTGIKLRELFLEKFKQNPEVKVPTDVRLTFKK